MAIIDIKATIDPVLAEHYPGRGLRTIVSATLNEYEVHAADGRIIVVEPGAVEGACRGVRDAWDRLFDTIDNALGIPLADREFVEIPVTRRARVTLVYREHLRAGDRFVVRSSPSSPFRAGIGIAGPGTLGDLLGCIPSACPGDLVYRVEPE